MLWHSVLGDVNSNYHMTISAFAQVPAAPDGSGASSGTVWQEGCGNPELARGVGGVPSVFGEGGESHEVPQFFAPIRGFASAPHPPSAGCPNLNERAGWRHGTAAHGRGAGRLPWVNEQEGVGK